MSETQTAVPSYLTARERAKAAGLWVQVLCLAGAGVCLAAAALQTGRLNELRAESQMRLNSQVLKEVPPDIALLNTTLGPFRGVWITSLWIQADKLKEQNRFYDALQRAQWICKLQPRFPMVWAFQAWNMAYNISVTKHTPEERWKWVTNGAHLLQLQGIPLNPRTLDLYKELAWIYFHKIGDVMDDMHLAYKNELAAEFERLLGVPDPSLDAAAEIDAFRPIAESPEKLSELIAKDPMVGEFLSRLGQIGYRADFQMLSDYHDAAALDMHLVKLKSDEKVEIDPKQQALLDLSREPGLAAQRDKVFAFARRQALHERHGMDAEFMLQTMERYGPLDWRLPFAHGIYWGYLGDERTKDVRNRSEAMVLINDRVIMFCELRMFAQGKLLFMIDLEQPNRSYYMDCADPRFIDYAHNNYLEYGKKHEEDPRDTAGAVLARSHMNLLSEAIRTLYFRGRLNAPDMQKAEYYYDYLREHYRNPDGTVRERYRRPLDEFVARQIEEYADTHRSTIELITSFTDAALLALATGDRQTYVVNMAYCKEAYDRYMRGKATDKQTRIKLPRFRRVVGRNLFNVLVSYPVPSYYKGRIWEHFLRGNEDELDVVRMIFDQSRSFLTAQCDAQGYDVNKLFAEPPGMDAYRAEHAGEEPFEAPHVPRPEERMPTAPEPEKQQPTRPDIS